MSFPFCLFPFPFSLFPFPFSLFPFPFLFCLYPFLFCLYPLPFTLYHTFYLTDTGRRWDGWKVSVRDKMPQQAEWVKQGLIFHSTRDIIAAANAGKLPDKIMITIHPQRWTDKPMPWIKELVFQGIKNQVKKVLVSMWYTFRLKCGAILE